MGERGADRAPDRIASTELVCTRAEVHRLHDGTEIVTRPIEPSDTAALTRFVDQLSDESNRYRFFNLHRHLPPSEVHGFTTVDHRDREAYVAMCADELIGVASYDRTTRPGCAEVAFTVADPWQGHGLATILLRRLAHHAQAAGITVFVAEVLADNRKMIEVFEHAATASSAMVECGVVHVEMPLESVHSPS